MKSKLKKKLLIRSMIFTLFLLGINTYAWFIYMDKFDGNINADVIAWDITLYDEDEVNALSLNINDLHPGMNNYTKTIRVNNNSDMPATFNYEMKGFTLFGVPYQAGSTYTSDDLINILTTYFPFEITFSKNKTDLYSNGDNAMFSINVNWPFEQDTEYYKINNFFGFDNKIDYYIYNNGYVIDDTVNINNFASKANNLYVLSDDADTYWGVKSSEYKKTNPSLPCLKLELDLIVTQSQL